MGWHAIYVKEVDENEQIVSFRQEIYNEHGTCVEIHQKYPDAKIKKITAWLDTWHEVQRW